MPKGHKRPPTLEGRELERITHAKVCGAIAGIGGDTERANDAITILRKRCQSALDNDKQLVTLSKEQSSLLLTIVAQCSEWTEALGYIREIGTALDVDINGKPDPNKMVSLASNEIDLGVL